MSPRLPMTLVALMACFGLAQDQPPDANQDKKEPAKTNFLWTGAMKIDGKQVAVELDLRGEAGKLTYTIPGEEPTTARAASGDGLKTEKDGRLTAEYLISRSHGVAFTLKPISDDGVFVLVGTLTLTSYSDEAEPPKNPIVLYRFK